MDEEETKQREAEVAEFERMLGYRFRDARLLDMALTTPARRMTYPEAEDNQRLEFLGDSVINMLAADDLYREHPKAQEGDLSVLRARLVSTAPLCAAAVRIGVKKLLKRNKGALELPDDAKVLADAMEAIAGAAWLDGGIEAARNVYRNFGLEAQAEEATWVANPKGELQVRAQAMHPHRHPEYEILSVTGASHAPLFTVRVRVDGIGEATGEARTRKEAEAAAAQALLDSGAWLRQSTRIG